MVNRYSEFLSNKPKATTAFLVIFYIVGIVGLLLPLTFHLFLKLIPFALILSFVALAFFHEGKFEQKTINSFLLIYLFTFIVEAIGVNTGLIFGYYEYGSGLGLKVLNTPLIIGINWLFLVYTTAAIVEGFSLHKYVKAIIAALGMLLYDIVLEQVAPKLDMWYWKDGMIPIQNYVAWFLVALVVHLFLKISDIKLYNKIAIAILTCQFMFFLILYFGFAS